MNLYDPDRPQIASRPAWLSRRAAISEPQLWIRQDGRCLLKMMLPMLGSSAYMYYQARIRFDELSDFMLDFREDPELAASSFFAPHYSDLHPDLYPKKALPSAAIALPSGKRRILLG